MEKFPDSEEDHAHAALPYQDSGQKRPQFKGIRKRKWGSWGSEIRIPKTREKIWLGSYKTAEQAARAYDAAVYCLRGPNAKFNFPGSVPAIPSTFSLSRRQIQLAAARYAREELSSHSTSPSPYKNKNKAREVPDCPTQSSLVSETVIPNDTGQQISEECDMALWDWEYSLFESSGFANLDKLPSIEEALGLDANPTWQEEEQDAGWLWNLSSMNYLLRETSNISSF